MTRPVKESTRDAYRDAVLAALDETSVSLFTRAHGVHDAGASDADLPELFRAIDAHTQRLVDRFGADYPEGSNHSRHGRKTHAAD